MTLARGLAAGALVVAVVIVAVILLGSGSSGHEYHLQFINAGQLVKGDDVQVGGRRIGSIEEITLTPNNQADIKVSVDSPVAPLHQGTMARVRLTSLSGIANRYIALTPGPNNMPKIPDNGRLRADQTTSVVDLDQLFNTLDPATRRSLQQFVQGSATQFGGKGQAQLANEATHFFNPALSTTTQVVSEVTRDDTVFEQFLINSSKVVTALAARQNDLTNLVTNTNTTAGAIASENASFDQALRVLPPTLRKANTTFVNLRATLDDLDPLVNASKPATRRLAPFLRALRPLVHDARPTIRDLRLLIHTPGPNNDLIDVMLKLPRLEAIAHPTFGRAVATLKRSQPVLNFIRPYIPELVGWFRDFGQGAAPYDANGHYARIQPIFNVFNFNGSKNLVPNPNGASPMSSYQGVQERNVLQRCPGTDSQVYPPNDTSAPFLDSGPFANVDCNPHQVLPGSNHP